MSLERVHREVKIAEPRIRPYVRRTYLDFSATLSHLFGCQIYLKLENLQYTGSFKLRGAFNKLLSLEKEQRERGVLTASTGNHGLAVAHALSVLGIKGLIYLPETVQKHKLEAVKRLGAECCLFGQDPADAELEARRAAEESDRVYISPYNDYEVIGGQGTVGLELCEQLGDFDTVLVAVGGGGLIGGIAAWLKKERPEVRIVGCLPENSPVMYECVRAGEVRQIHCLPTLSDGTAGGLEVGSVTFPLCRDLVDEWVLVSEDEILVALKLLVVHEHQLVEGAAAVPLAALSKVACDTPGHRVVMVLCGGNVGLEVLRRVVA